MKKWVIAGSSGLVVLGLGWLAISHWWQWPFIPASWRASFTLNANILPASDKSRAQYVAINPGFRVEFGDKDNPTSAYLRFERTGSDPAATTNSDVNHNLLDALAASQVVDAYQPGLEWQLFSVGIDESQLVNGTSLGEDAEVLRLTQQLLGETLIASPSGEVAPAAAAAAAIQTQTLVERFQGYDQVINQEVAPDVDLKYTVVPGRGIRSEIWIGDRDYFDTACLQLLGLTGSEAGCNLPSNKFSFLLQLDAGQRLIHVPLAIDDSQQGTYYVVDEAGRYLLRLANPQLVDAAGQTSSAVQLEVRPGEVAGEVVESFYIVTYTANLSWLLEADRSFPVQVVTGFYIDGEDFFGQPIATAQ